MNLLSPKTIKELLSEYSTVPRKGLGQNFLINPSILKKIIAASNLRSDDTVLEIGPGIGTLTQELAKHAKKVIAIEKDGRMVEILKETMKGYKNVEIIAGDILKITPSSLPLQKGEELGKEYKLIANLPYYITSPVIRKFLEEKNRPQEMILMMQKEVAQRICASPPNMSLLAISVQFYAKPEIISYVSKGSFWPAPKVDSAILRIKPHPKYPNIPISQFFNVLHAGFSAPRKQLGGNLAKGLKIEKTKIINALEECKIKPEQRAETLNIQDWMKLTRCLG